MPYIEQNVDVVICLLVFLTTFGLDAFLYRNAYRGTEIVISVFRIYAHHYTPGFPRRYHSNVLKKAMSETDIKRLAGDFRYICNGIIFFILLIFALSISPF